MTEFAWALVGPGKIARRFASAVRQLSGTRLHSVLGRDADRAQAFAKEFAASRSTTDLAALLADPAVDGVYVATPHSEHGEIVRACLEAGKPVLCEKPLVPSLAQAEPLVALARERCLFLMEAVWTRFLPVYTDVLQGWLREQQAIGELRGLQSSFCFPALYHPDSRLFDPALAGGALLDIGIYNLTVTRWVLQQALGTCPELLTLRAEGVLAPTGVDQRVNATLGFRGDLVSQFICGIDGSSDNALHILGTRGSITLPHNFWQATEARLQLHGELSQTVAAPFRINGFEGEIEEAMRCIRAGLVESPLMPHAESLATLGWMDEIRRQLGVRYPFE
ncbi:Gfo/Idh/MocA family oxidoreductase [Paucibacter sp. PLA-PC-4]|uniref:Gfo/Idh/MocA family protein n=1 Tax=Paucibacter sp. PLA-PC-4 TaxID=2993655 RepID=UPI002248C670|nr:Gfo/Idh/MocA family oxidoreductase [Paucibacter sp. PLA-PC-4]MCX2860672.1 Gfo/Idh/MocA family oxidoreductase [Paucibacter sp. PLA-PC-4]